MKSETTNGIKAKDLKASQQYDIKMGDKNIGRFGVEEKSTGSLFSTAYIILRKAKNNEWIKQWLNSEGNIVKSSVMITFKEFDKKFTATPA